MPSQNCHRAGISEFQLFGHDMKSSFVDINHEIVDNFVK